AANREMVSLKIKEWTDRFANWVSGITDADWDGVVSKVKSVGSAITAIADAINSTVDALRRFDKFNEPRIKALDAEAGKYGPRMNLPGQSSSGAIVFPRTPSMSPGTSTAGWGRG